MAGITDKEVRALIASAKREGKTASRAEGTVPGLTLTVSATGTAAWVLRYRIGEKRKEATIGKFPAWGTADARAKAKELRRAVDDGLDVAAEKQRQKQEAAQVLTVDKLAEDYFDQVEKSLDKPQGMRPHTFKQRRSIHVRYVSPLIGSYAVSEITPLQVVAVVKKSEAGGKTLPDITLTHCNLIFAHAIGRGACAANPCRDLKLSAITGPQEPPKQRISLTANELSAFLRALALIPRQYALAIRLMLLSGVRINTIAEAMADEFDIEAGLWRVPHERRKNRRHTTGPFVIPLPPEAVDWVRELLILADGDEYLLPVKPIRGSSGRNPLSKRTSIATWMDRARTEAGGGWPRITPHDLRSTCKSWLSELRVDYEVRQRYLDHALDGIDKIYDKADYLEHRREAAMRWLRFLNDCEGGGAGATVIRLPSAA